MSVTTLLQHGTALPWPLDLLTIYPLIFDIKIIFYVKNQERCGTAHPAPVHVSPFPAQATSTLTTTPAHALRQS